MVLLLNDGRCGVKLGGSRMAFLDERAVYVEDDTPVLYLREEDLNFKRE